MNEYLRPDEKAAQSDVERSKRQDQRIKSGLKTAANIGVAATGVGIAAKSLGPLSSRILPFINEYIPIDMAIKGISKVSPELGNLLNKGMSQGLNIKDGLDFIKGQIEKKQEPAKPDRNIIQQYSPELHEFISGEVSGGRSPIEAAAIAQHDKRFSDVIKKLSKDHKTPWSSIIESVYGGEGKAQPQPQGQMQQGGQGQQALMAMLQKLQQARGMK